MSHTSDLISLTHSIHNVNHFLKVFKIIFWIVLTFRSFPTTFAILPPLSQFVNTFLKLFFEKILSGDGGIWTLAPVTRPTPLAGAPLQPLEYISLPENSLPRYSIFHLQTSYFHACAEISLSKKPFIVNAFFAFFENNFLYCVCSRHNLFLYHIL